MDTEHWVDRWSRRSKTETAGDAGMILLEFTLVEVYVHAWSWSVLLSGSFQMSNSKMRSTCFFFFFATFWNIDAWIESGGQTETRKYASGTHTSIGLILAITSTFSSSLQKLIKHNSACEHIFSQLYACSVLYVMMALFQQMYPVINPGVLMLLRS